MKLRNVKVVFGKEFRDLMRDRRTIVGMFVVPIFLFPLVTVGFDKFERRIKSQVAAEAASVMVLGAEHAPELAEKLCAADGLRVVPPADDYRQQINDKKLRAAVEFPAGFAEALRTGTDHPPEVRIYYYQAESRSQAAGRKIEQLVRDYREAVLADRLSSRGLQPEILKPVSTQRENVADAKKVSGMKLAMLLPYMIIILCLTGAMHPAIDMTAGEKERGTLETILASAVSRWELVTGKFLLVLMASVGTAIMSLLSFGASIYFAGDYAADLTKGYSYSISFTSMAAIFLLVLPLAVFFAGALIAIALFAKNYKEAQNYLGPLMILVILPAMASMFTAMAGGSPSLAMAWVPILNVSMATQELLTGQFPAAFYGVTLLSTALMAGGSLFAAVLMFQREEVLFRN